MLADRHFQPLPCALTPTLLSLTASVLSRFVPHHSIYSSISDVEQMVKVGVWRDWSCQCFSLPVTLIRSLLSQWGSRKPYQPLFGFMTENSRVGTHSEIFIFLFILFHLSQISFTRSTITVCVTSWLSCGEHTTYTVRHAAGQLYHLTLAAMNVIVVWWEKPVLYPFVEACFSAGCWFSASFGSVTSYSTASKPSTLPGRKTWETKNNPTSLASVLVLCVGVHAFIWQSEMLTEIKASFGCKI